ncbi:MAG: response regulator transcription factor [Desulfobulbaceae bacterium]|nr:response regulator transcription factor [Desulfobulbaceae bacterium]
MGYKILIVDDHVLLRKGIRSILENSPSIEFVAEAGDGFEAIEAARDQEFDLVLLDISMPNKDGIDTLKQLKYEFPRLKVLMLSMYPEESYAIRALRAGASGYLEKDCRPEQLEQAINDVITLGKYISPTIVLALANTIDSTSKASSYDLLSDREVQVMRLLASANTVSEIAEQLHISAKTVTTYKSRILEKLNLKNTAELIRYALEKKVC